MGINALNTAQVDSLPVTTSSVQQETRRDPVISPVVQYTNYGWPTAKCNQELNVFYTRIHEITVHQECLMWALREVIPAKLRHVIVVVKMKMLARSYIWWPGIDGDIETLAKQCTGCQQSQHMPKSAPIHPASNGLVERIVQSFKQAMYSSRPEKGTIQKKLPKSAPIHPYHPASNGLADVLFNHSSKPCILVYQKKELFRKSYPSFYWLCTTNTSPAKLFMRRELRTKLQLIKSMSILNKKIYVDIAKIHIVVLKTVNM
ncbi:hypothetical protein SNE40_001601 [Patella caerulea]|uniref:Integrase zinc-binding domain-containing protein n=1 Tax=Patella caerulea TaxID=87958 RepID=A0AAN8QI73_PATCE